MSNRAPVPFVDLGAQLSQIRPDIDAAIAGVLERGDYILGASVERFEEEFAAYCQTRFAVGVDSGTSGLELALTACGVGAGHEVITAANTFIATALAISHAGARPVLVDLAPGTFNMDPAAVERAITPDTRAIVPVHLYGYPADMAPLMEIARRHGLAVVEDASQAHGARYGGNRVGTFGDAAAFSLYPAKNLGALGDAGVVVTNDPDIADALRLARNYGSPVKYHHVSKGHNRRLDTLQAAVLRVKLPYLDDWNRRRRANAAAYNRLLGDSEGVLAPPGDGVGAEAVYHLYVIRCEQRDRLQRHLSNEGISTVIHYPVPIHLQPAYADLGHSRGDFPIAEQYAREVLSLPMYPELAEAGIERVAAAIERFPANLRSMSYTVPAVI